MTKHRIKKRSEGVANALLLLPIIFYYYKGVSGPMYAFVLTEMKSVTTNIYCFLLPWSKWNIMNINILIRSLISLFISPIGYIRGRLHYLWEQRRNNQLTSVESYDFYFFFMVRKCLALKCPLVEMHISTCYQKTTFEELPPDAPGEDAPPIVPFLLYW